MATVVNGIAGAISGVALPFLMNPDQANLGGKIAFIYGGALALASAYIWWKWPETKGLRFAEIDELFEKGVASRSFGKAELRSKTTYVAKLNEKLEGTKLNVRITKEEAY